MDIPLPEPAFPPSTCAPAGPYRSAPEPAAPTSTAPALSRVSLAALVVALCAFGAASMALYAVRVVAVSRHCVLPSVHAREVPPEARFDTAAQELARRAHRPLFIAPGLDARARTMALSLGDIGAPEETVRALDAYAAARGLWFHEAGGVLRLERAVTALRFDCDDTLSTCATRLERVASLDLTFEADEGRRPVRIHLTPDLPAAQGTRDALQASGLVVDLVGRVLYVTAPAPSEVARLPEVAPRALGEVRRLRSGVYVVSPAFVDALLENQALLGRSVRIHPFSRGGRVLGVALRARHPNDLLARLGLRDGDVITHVNGHELTANDPGRQRLNRSEGFVLQLERDGRPMRIAYVVGPVALR